MAGAPVGVAAQGAAAAPVVPAPPAAISLTVSPLVPSFAAPGTELLLHYTITNTGGQTLTGITAHNSLPGVAVNCVQSTLGAGQATECLARYITTPADVASGGVTTTATAIGTPTTGSAVTSSPASTTIPALAGPALALAKSTYYTQTFSRAGQPIGYVYRIANTGNAPVSGITVHDPHPGLTPVRCDVTTVAPGDAIVCFAGYQTTTADLAAGQITNTATATGTPPSGPAVTSNPASWTIYTPQPWFSLTKSVSPTTYTTGTRLNYSYTLTKTGNDDLTGVAVADALPGVSPVSCPSTVLTGRPMTCTATYTAGAADVRAGSITNTATATGAGSNGARTTAGPATATAFAAGPPSPPNTARRFVFVPVPFPLPLGAGR
jgi:uncharacterized repeat protein (TIGR01451 family)